MLPDAARVAAKALARLRRTRRASTGSTTTTTTTTTGKAGPDEAPAGPQGCTGGGCLRSEPEAPNSDLAALLESVGLSSASARGAAATRRLRALSDCASAAGARVTTWDGRVQAALVSHRRLLDQPGMEEVLACAAERQAAPDAAAGPEAGFASGLSSPVGYAGNSRRAAHDHKGGAVAPPSPSATAPRHDPALVVKMAKRLMGKVGRTYGPGTPEFEAMLAAAVAEEQEQLGGGAGGAARSPAGSGASAAEAAAQQDLAAEVQLHQSIYSALHSAVEGVVRWQSGVHKWQLKTWRQMQSAYLFNQQLLCALGLPPGPDFVERPRPLDDSGLPHVPRTPVGGASAAGTPTPGSAVNSPPLAMRMMMGGMPHAGPGPSPGRSPYAYASSPVPSFSDGIISPSHLSITEANFAPIGAPRRKRSSNLGGPSLPLPPFAEPWATAAPEPTHGGGNSAVSEGGRWAALKERHDSVKRREAMEEGVLEDFDLMQPRPGSAGGSPQQHDMGRGRSIADTQSGQLRTVPRSPQPYAAGGGRRSSASTAGWLPQEFAPPPLALLAPSVPASPALGMPPAARAGGHDDDEEEEWDEDQPPMTPRTLAALPTLTGRAPWGRMTPLLDSLRGRFMTLMRRRSSSMQQPPTADGAPGADGGGGALETAVPSMNYNMMYAVRRRSIEPAPPEKQLATEP